jgi:hypothetical protein
LRYADANADADTYAAFEPNTYAVADANTVADTYPDSDADAESNAADRSARTGYAVLIW